MRTKMDVTDFVTPGNDEPVPNKMVFGNALARSAVIVVVVVCSSDSPSDGHSSPLLSVSSSSTFNSLALIRPVNEKRYCVPDVVGSI